MTALTPTAESRAAASAAISHQRRSLAESSLLAFAQIYLDAHFRLAPSPMHLELFTMLPEATERRGRRIAIAAPRGHAKTTVVSLAFILWCACFRREPYVVLISDTSDQAGDLLTAIRQELEGNQLLASDFPQIAGERVSAKALRWRRHDVTLPNGVRIQALGAEQKLRGRRNRAERPTLIVLDDIENEELVRSAEQREKRWDWLCRAVLKAGTGSTNVIVVGTVLHHDSVLCRLLDPKNPKHQPGWTRRTHRAVVEWATRTDLWEEWSRIYSGLEQLDGSEGPDAARAFFDARMEEMLEGATALWPERESYYELMELRIREGRAAFDAEKQNDPVDGSQCLLAGIDPVYWDDRFESEEDLLEHLGDSAHIVGACDPSLGRRGGRGDPSAVVTVARNTRDGTIYVLDADIRSRPPDELIDAILALEPRRRWDSFGVEANHFQALMSTELRRRGADRGLYVSTVDITNTSDKIARIQSLQALIGSGTLRLCRRHTLLLEQLRQFPHAAHDDGPDALEMAVRLSLRNRSWVLCPSEDGEEASTFRVDGDWPWSSMDEWVYQKALKDRSVSLTRFEQASRNAFLKARAARAAKQ